MRIYLLCLLFFLTGCQTTSSTRPCKSFEIPKYVDQQLMADLSTLASLQANGRKTGTPGHKYSYQYIIERFKDIGLQSWRGGYTQRFSHPKLKKRTGVNVLGFLQGKLTSDKLIVVTAHYDHLGGRGRNVYLGADDNASGVAMMMALATYLTRYPPQFSVLFVATDAEEKGLLGSEQLIASKTIDINKAVFNINLDMVARAKRLYYLSSKPKNDIFHQKIKQIEQACLISRRTHRSFSNTKVIDYKKASDHFSFARQGVDYIFIGGGQHADYHGVGDNVARISPTHFSNRVAVVNQLYALIEQSVIDSLKESN